MLYKHLGNSLNYKDEDKNFDLNKNSRNKNILLLSRYINEYQSKDRPATAKYIYNRKKSIKSFSNSYINSISITKKQTTPNTHSSINTPGPSQIYLRLKQKNQIAKIVKEQSKKIYFKQKINYGNHLSVEELRRRFMNPIPQNAYKRYLKRRIKEKINLRAKTFFQKNAKKFDFNNNIKDLIKTNKKLIRNFRIASTNRQIDYSKNNLKIVNNYIQKVKENKKRASLLMSRRVDSNTTKILRKIDGEDSSNKMNEHSLNLDKNKYKRIMNKIILKRQKKQKEKSKIFDNIIIDELNTNKDKIKSIEDKTVRRNDINYVALSNKIFFENVIKKMKIIFIKDPDMNSLNNDSKNIPNLGKNPSLFDEFESIYNKYTDDITFSRYNKIKLTLPKFIKTKFKKKTNFKYGQITDNFFGVPV